MNTSTIKYIKCVGGTEIVLDKSRPSHDNYIGHVWHDDSESELLGIPAWNINNGTTYLYGFSSRDEAVQAIMNHEAGNQ